MVTNVLVDLVDKKGLKALRMFHWIQVGYLSVDFYFVRTVALS